MRLLIKEVAPTVVEHPEARTKEDTSLIETILAEAERDERRRTILREAEERYRNELMDEEERLMLEERIKKIRKALGL